MGTQRPPGQDRDTRHPWPQSQEMEGTRWGDTTQCPLPVPSEGPFLLQGHPAPGCGASPLAGLLGGTGRRWDKAPADDSRLVCIYLYVVSLAGEWHPLGPPHASAWTPTGRGTVTPAREPVNKMEHCPLALPVCHRRRHRHPPPGTLSHPLGTLSHPGGHHHPSPGMLSHVGGHCHPLPRTLSPLRDTLET